MVLCYHKEAFISGMLSALVLFSVIILFEDVIGKFFEGIKNRFL